jgi:hypothetical protein
MIFLGCAMIVIGLLVYSGHSFGWLGRLPGDISIKKDNFSFYFPFTSGIVVSVILTFLLFLLNKR